MGDGVFHVPAGEALLLLEEEKEGIGIVAIDLDLLEAGELGTEIQLAELMDALVCARGLLSELVAGEVENLEALGMVLLVEFAVLTISNTSLAYSFRDTSLPFLSLTVKS